MNKDKLTWYDRKRLWCGLPWTFTKYGLSEDRLYVEIGLLTTKHYDLRLYRITNTGMTRTLIQKIFGMGTIHIDANDKDLGCFDLINVKGCESIKDLLDELVEKERIKNKVMVREYIADSADDCPEDDEFGSDDIHDEE